MLPYLHVLNFEDLLQSCRMVHACTYTCIISEISILTKSSIMRIHIEPSLNYTGVTPHNHAFLLLYLLSCIVGRVASGLRKHVKRVQYTLLFDTYTTLISQIVHPYGPACYASWSVINF